MKDYTLEKRKYVIGMAAVVIVLISQLDARQQAALSAGADSFISKGETPDRVAERLLSAAANGRSR